MAEQDVIRGKTGSGLNSPTSLGARKYHSMGVEAPTEGEASYLSPGFVATRTVYVKKAMLVCRVVPESASGVDLVLEKRTGSTTVNPLHNSSINLKSLVADTPTELALGPLSSITLQSGDCLVAAVYSDEFQTAPEGVYLTLELENAD